MNKLAIIGGSGLYNIDGIKDEKWITVKTPWGEPSDQILEAKIDNNQIENEIKGNQVTSPIVGTFYRKPSPDKEPFVKVGDIVNKGDVLCIIEAMKMMNEIKSEFDGKISSIEVDDGQPVEFGQTIIVIE